MKISCVNPERKLAGEPKPANPTHTLRILSENTNDENSKQKSFCHLNFVLRIFHPNATIPGSSFPASNSSIAPPPVDT